MSVLTFFSFEVSIICAAFETFLCSKALGMVSDAFSWVWNSNLLK